MFYTHSLCMNVFVHVFSSTKFYICIDLCGHRYNQDIDNSITRRTTRDTPL